VYAVAAMPVVAAGLGVVMLDQPITLEVVAGGLMVMAAVYVGAIARKKRPAPVAVPPAASGATHGRSASARRAR
jgi:hypothetical protein